ncbi:hypothetical protein ABK040_008349 [Willaertia magna]
MQTNLANKEGSKLKVFHYCGITKECFQGALAMSNDFQNKYSEKVFTNNYYELSIADIIIASIDNNIWLIEDESNQLKLRILTDFNNQLEYYEKIFLNMNELLQYLLEFYEKRNDSEKKTIICKYLQQHNNELELKQKKLVTLETIKTGYTYKDTFITFDLCKTKMYDFLFYHAVLKIPISEENKLCSIQNLLSNIQNYNSGLTLIPGRSAVIEWLRLTKPQIYEELTIVNKAEDLSWCYEVDDSFDYDSDDDNSISFNSIEERMEHYKMLNIQNKIIVEKRNYNLKMWEKMTQHHLLQNNEDNPETEY